MVPMDATLNRGDWRAMENTWKRALKGNQNVEVKIQPVYKGSSTRPDAFIVRYKIQGKGWTMVPFKN
jgi:filamentous hemagglutinin